MPAGEPLAILQSLPLTVTFGGARWFYREKVGLAPVLGHPRWLFWLVMLIVKPGTARVQYSGRSTP